MVDPKAEICSVIADLLKEVGKLPNKMKDDNELLYSIKSDITHAKNAVQTLNRSLDCKKEDSQI